VRVTEWDNIDRQPFSSANRHAEPCSFPAFSLWMTFSRCNKWQVVPVAARVVAIHVTRQRTSVQEGKRPIVNHLEWNNNSQNHFGSPSKGIVALKPKISHPARVNNSRPLSFTITGIPPLPPSFPAQPPERVSVDHRFPGIITSFRLSPSTKHHHITSHHIARPHDTPAR